MNLFVRTCCLVGVLALQWGCASKPSEEVYIAPSPDVSKNDSMQVLWRKDLSEDYPHGSVDPSLTNDHLYMLEGDNTIVALDTQNGHVIWRYQSPAAVTGGLTSTSDMVAFGTSEGDLIAVNAQNGEALFETKLQNEILSKPLISAGYIIAQTANDTLAAFSLATKEQRWLYAQDVPPLSLRGNSSPATANGAVIAGFANGMVGVYLLKEGFQAWQQRISQAKGKTEIQRIVDIDADPLVFGRVLYVASYQGHISALDLQSGKILWQQKNSTYKNFIIDEFLLICTTADGHVRAFDRRTGQIEWEQEALFGRNLSAPVAIKHQIVVGDYQGYLYWLNRDNGKIESKYAIENAPIARNMIVSDDKLYLYAEDGEIIALQKTVTP